MVQCSCLLLHLQFFNSSFSFPFLPFPSVSPTPPLLFSRCNPFTPQKRSGLSRTSSKHGITSYNKTMSTGQTPLSSRSSQGLDHRSKGTHGGTHGSSHICGRGWPCWTSVGGEALGPEGVQCPSIGECQGERMGEWVEEHPHRGRGKGDGMRGC